MGMVYCRGCAKEIHESAPTCPHCGAIQEVALVQKEGEVSTALIVAGYITAFLFPIAGGIIGIYTIIKGKTGHGIGMLAIAFITVLIFAIAWLGVIMANPY